MRPVARVINSSTADTVSTSKVVRNTYTLLAITLLFSAVTAGISIAINPPTFTGIVCSLAAMALIWFALPRTANSAAGLGVVFAITGLLGFGLGPVLSHYLHTPHGSQIVMQALGTTGVVFIALSAYVMVTKKDFSFLGGFLAAGMIVAVVSMLAVMVASLFGYPMPGISLALSALVALLMCGFILFDTSRIINGGETNYIVATIGLYLSIYNLFVTLLQLMGVLNEE